MPGLTEIKQLLEQMRPVLTPGEYVFCSFPGARYGDLAALDPVATVRENEGLTLVLERVTADRAGLAYEGVFRAVLLRVHSSLEAVGLTAAVAGALAREGISANMVAGYFHDHVYVQAERAEEAVCILQSLGS